MKEQPTGHGPLFMLVRFSPIADFTVHEEAAEGVADVYRAEQRGRRDFMRTSPELP
jgi:hypothetical protein